MLDVDAIHQILVVNADRFQNRGLYNNVNTNPLTQNLIQLDGTAWKELHVRKNFGLTLKKEIRRDILADLYGLIEQFNADVIGSLAFGLSDDFEKIHCLACLKQLLTDKIVNKFNTQITITDNKNDEGISLLDKRRLFIDGLHLKITPSTNTSSPLGQDSLLNSNIEVSFNSSLWVDCNASLDGGNASKYLDLDACKGEQNFDSSRSQNPPQPPPSSPNSCSFAEPTDNSLSDVSMINCYAPRSSQTKYDRIC
uniref:Uncharacterized protein n=1 Tax=Glossina palpalis gambiensis TaxID=67801 RepID=A0A1B0BYE3_9MUSC